MPGIASFHLVRDPSAVRSMAHLGLDRRRLAGVPGLRFWRLLGTGRGAATGPGADLRRTAMFAIWDDEGALDSFATSMRRRWQPSEGAPVRQPARRPFGSPRDGTEAWHVRLRGSGGHGAWRGMDVLGAIEPAQRADGPVAIITRADVRRGAWRAFRAVGPAVSEELHAADGLLAVVGIGEAPLGRLGTFSLWSDLEAARTFARTGAHHSATVRRTRAEGWYGEELFARFEPYASAGSWDGRDPLAATGRGD